MFRINYLMGRKNADEGNRILFFAPEYFLN